MDLGKIQRLQQQAALSRAARLQASYHKAKLPDRPHGVASSYDADSGMDIIRLSDGSTQYAFPDTSGVRSPGDSVVVRQGGGTTHVDAIKAKSVQPVPTKRKLLKTEQHTFKILFSVVEGNIQKFYIGGDRPTPQLIFEIDINIYDGDERDIGVTDGPTYIHGFISSFGIKPDDWIAGIRYSKWDADRFDYGDDIQYLSIINPTINEDFIPSNNIGITYPIDVTVTTYSDYETTGIGLLHYKGAGLWISNLENILDIRFYYWEEENFASFIDYQIEVNTTNPQATIPVINSENWNLNKSLQTPFPSVEAFAYSPTNHTGIRALIDACTFNTNEVYTFSSQSNGNPNNTYYLPPSGSFAQGEQENPGSSLAHSTLLGKCNPYLYTNYTDGNYSEFFKGASISSTNYSSRYGIRSVSTTRYEAGHYSQDAVRKYLLISGNNPPIKVDYGLKMTEGSFFGSRIANVGSSQSQSWSRKPYIYKCNGRNYLLPDFWTPVDAISIETSDKLTITENNQPIVTPQTTRVQQNYQQTVAASAKLNYCLYYTASIDLSIDNNRNLLIPENVNFYIYNKQTNTFQPIIETAEIKVTFNPRTDTFIGSSIVYVNTIPTELKIEDIKITPNTKKFVPSANGLTIKETLGKPIVVRSLNIDTTNTHYIHNLSYF